MKKLIALMAILFALVSCYKVEQYNVGLRPNYFLDSVTLGDTVQYNMSCAVNRESAEINFAMKKYIVKEVITWDFGEAVYTTNRDSVVTRFTNHNYTPDEFRIMLLVKNKEQRDTTIFKFDDNMYMSWKVFDEMYNNYIAK